MGKSSDGLISARGRALWFGGELGAEGAGGGDIAGASMAGAGRAVDGACGIGLTRRGCTDRGGGLRTGGGVFLARSTSAASWELFIGMAASPWHVLSPAALLLATACLSCRLLRWNWRLRPSCRRLVRCGLLLRQLRRIGQAHVPVGCPGRWRAQGWIIESLGSVFPSGF